MARNITTTNYSWPNPDPTDKVNTAGYWGTDLYDCIVGIDAKIASVAASMPYIPSTTVFVMSASTPISTTGYKTVLYSGTAWVAAGIFTPPTAGTYAISAFCKISYPGGYTSCNALLFDNALLLAMSVNKNDQGSYNFVSIGGTFYLSAAASVFIQAKGVSGSVDLTGTALHITQV